MEGSNLLFTNWEKETFFFLRQESHLRRKGLPFQQMGAFPPFSREDANSFLIFWERRERGGVVGFAEKREVCFFSFWGRTMPLLKGGGGGFSLTKKERGRIGPLTRSLRGKKTTFSLPPWEKSVHLQKGTSSLCQIIRVRFLG